MGAIDQAFIDLATAAFAQVIKPLQQEIADLKKIVESQSAPADEWVKQKELPAKLGNIGLTKVRELRRHPNAPKPNVLGLYSVNDWREFVKNTTTAE